MHTDIYGPNDLPVDTYITICAGVKRVIMLPPGKNFFEEEKDSLGEQKNVDGA